MPESQIDRTRFVQYRNIILLFLFATVITGNAVDDDVDDKPDDELVCMNDPPVLICHKKYQTNVLLKGFSREKINHLFSYS